jgi:uncharacterized protein
MQMPPEPAASAAPNDVIFETVITTVSRDGVPHVAPMGVRYRNIESFNDNANAADNAIDDASASASAATGHVVLMPFKPSTTLDNIETTGHAVLNIVTDTRVFAGCVTGRKAWPVVPAERIAGVRLAVALSHVELRLAERRDDAQRPVLWLARVFEAVHAPFTGFNRAQSAVLEGAILVSRLHLLSPEKIETEMNYLQIAIDKTAGAAEREAWGWLCEAVARHRSSAAGAAEARR